jgi:predicted metal-binding protein
MLTPGDSPSLRSPGFRVHVCDGCCCGSVRKHPGIDHETQRGRIAAAARSGGGEARVVECLGMCDSSNVVVVRRRGGPSHWIGNVLTESVTADLCDWLSAGALIPPASVVSRMVDRNPPERIRPASIAVPVVFSGK